MPRAVSKEEEPGLWAVHVIDRFGDGEHEWTVFHGPYSEMRALQYTALLERAPFPTPSPATPLTHKESAAELMRLGLTPE